MNKDLLKKNRLIHTLAFHFRNLPVVQGILLSRGEYVYLPDCRCQVKIIS